MLFRQCPPGTFRYTIKAGDTFHELAHRFRTTVAALISANPNVNPDNLQIGQVICVPLQRIFPACPEGNYYRIRRGDTLFSIARFFSVSVDDLIEANPGIIPERLFIGQVICIPLATPPVACPPDHQTHTVKAGETFFSIAREHGITVGALMRANSNINPDALLIGQKICIPKPA